MNIKHIIILLAILLSQSLFAQQGTFTKIFSGNSYDEGIAVFRLPDKTYRIVGNTGAWGWGQTNVWFIALDTAANFAWHKTFGFGGINKATDATMDSKGNIYIIGNSTSESGKSYQMLLLGIDTLGAIFTKRFYGGNDWDFGNGIEVINDTILMLVGETYSYTSKQSDAWILKTKTNGDTLWTKTVGGNKKESFNSIKPMPVEGYICVGKSQSYGNGSFDPLIYKCNNNGDSLLLFTEKDTTDGAFNELIIGDDSVYVAVGYQKDTSNSYRDVLINKYYANDQLQWRNYSIQGAEANVCDLIQRADSILIFGKTRKNTGNYDEGYFMQYQNGWWISGKEFGGYKHDNIYKVFEDTLNNANSILMIGSTTSYKMQHSGILFIKMNSELLFDTTRQVDIVSNIKKTSSNNIDIRISPNPFTYNISLNITTLPSKDIEINVYDLTGKLAHRSLWTKGKKSISLNTSKWRKGSYIIMLTSDNISFTKLIIKP